MNMKQMPFKIKDGAIEQAKYRAKMAIREEAERVEPASRRVHWRWASSTIAFAVIAIGAFGVVEFCDTPRQEPTPMEKLLAEMSNASDELIYDIAVDHGYYLEEENNI